MDPQKGARRLVVLDGLRGIAILLVLGRHAGPGLRPLWEFGWMGVDLFFVLSGFLVSGLLFHEYRRHGRIRPFWFLGRRGFKIYPAFYFLLLVTWLLGRRFIPGRYFVYEALFVQNYFGFIWNQTWSLAVEEHFYFGLTLTAWALARFQPAPDPFRGLPQIGAVVLALVLALRLVVFSIHPD